MVAQLVVLVSALVGFAVDAITARRPQPAWI